MHAASSPYHRPVLGIALKLASILLFAGMMLCVKLLGQDIPTGQTVFARGAISVLVLAGIAWHTKRLHLLRTSNWRSHALRSLSGTVSMFCSFTALTLIPLADVTAISFTAPMFLTLLAMVFLGERIHRFRWTALGIGFLGVSIMIGPHLSFAEGASFGVWLALAAAITSAVAMVFLRSMSLGEHALTITFYFSLTFMVCSALTIFHGWAVPTPMQWLTIVLAGLFGVIGQLLMTYSYRYAQASALAPLDYSNMILMVAIGYLVFAEIPSTSVWIGAPLVVISGLIILWREYALKKTPSAPTPEA
ncbi:DMT family transporter [Steroidobacter sp.]|uniref:DMT family transporter n=1 Tax=Steroidobacter sp. TaxID=1978227 RepID=UPI001A44CB16|nr:DMT family transporter [Steroidobacter sp.]MBL8266547.1 DMT family transporter [Steroidobacter sp.]